MGHFLNFAQKGDFRPEWGIFTIMAKMGYLRNYHPKRAFSPKMGYFWDFSPIREFLPNMGNFRNFRLKRGIFAQNGFFGIFAQTGVFSKFSPQKGAFSSIMEFFEIFAQNGAFSLKMGYFRNNRPKRSIFTQNGVFPKFSPKKGQARNFRPKVYCDSFFLRKVSDSERMFTCAKS